MNRLDRAGAPGAALVFVSALAPAAFAQVDLSGQWASRWKASSQTLPERQCIPHGADNLFSRAGFPKRIWAEEHPATQKTLAYRIRSYAWSGITCGAAACPTARTRS